MPLEPPLFICLGCWLVAGLTFFVGYRRAARRYDIISEVPGVACRDVPGLGGAMVEVNGTVRCATPVVSDLARVTCVAFVCSVTEHWTTTRTERDSKGNTRTVTEHHSETRYSNDIRVSFDVCDESGSVRVEPEAASIDLLDSMDGLDGPRPDSPAYDITPHHFGGRLRYSESVLPVEQRVYVLGQVGAENQITQPDCDRPYIISYRSEESLLSAARWEKRIYAAVSFVLFVGGCVALIVGTQQRF